MHMHIIIIEFVVCWFDWYANAVIGFYCVWWKVQYFPPTTESAANVGQLITSERRGEHIYGAIFHKRLLMKMCGCLTSLYTAIYPILALWGWECSSCIRVCGVDWHLWPRTTSGSRVGRSDVSSQLSALFRPSQRRVDQCDYVIF